MSETDDSTPNMLVLKLLHGILEKTVEQNNLLSILIIQQQSTLRQTQTWKEENKQLSKQYGDAARIANKLMQGVMEEVSLALEELDEDPGYGDTEYQLTEFLDKYGPRVQQLGIIVQMLSNLGT